MKLTNAAAFLLALSLPAALHADDAARFNLQGPKIDVRVTRGSVTLPIAQVPNLQGGDRLWVKADLPATQSNHLLLIVAFLRGTTNEPPDNWFTEIDTWDKKDAEGTVITVPNEAQQALMFIAPETGGDFKTLRSAVKGKPGLFIRADADLNEASFEQQRIERYLAAMKAVPQDDPNAIKDHSAKLAATLALKPDDKCLKLPVDQQVVCLTQSSAPVLLNDGHGMGIAEALSTGPSSDFINTASYTQPVGGGLYSAYVGAVVDLVHLVSTLRTAQYQYIPGLAFPQEDALNLKLNAPPSFHKPMTVIVVGLPAIQKAKLPPLKPHDANEVACLLQPKMNVPLEGAPLVFSTAFAHDMVLHLNRTGAPTELPLTPDAYEGGLIVEKEKGHKPLDDKKPGANKADAKVGGTNDLTVTGTIRGYWGFDSFEGPTVTVQQVAGKGWKITGDGQLLAGQDSHISLKGDGTACVQHIALTNGKDKDTDVTFKPAKVDGKDSRDTLDLAVSLKKQQPGGYSLGIQQYGDANQDKVSLTAYTGDFKLDVVKIHSGDNTAVLTGQGLKDVASVQIGDQAFTPVSEGSDDKTLHLQAKGGASPADGSQAKVKLKDDRTMDVKVSTAAARPTLKLLSFNVVAAEKNGALPVKLGDKDEIPLDGKLTFVVQTKDAFPRSQTVEVATADNSVHTALSLANNNLVLQDEHTAVATLEPLKAFGQSAFGKLAMRPVAADGTGGDWTGLGVLVRTPEITAVHCTTADAPTCTVDGRNLFFVQSFGAGKDFAKPADIPTGFSESSFSVPTPADGVTLYLKLRDDPKGVATLTLPAPVAKPASASVAATSPAKPAPTAASPANDSQPSLKTPPAGSASSAPAGPQAAASPGKPAPSPAPATQPGQPAPAAAPAATPSPEPAASQPAQPAAAAPPRL